MGTLASQTEIGVQAPGTLMIGSGDIKPRKNSEIVYAKSCNLVHFRRKKIRNAIQNEFLNTLTVGTPSYAFRQLFNNGNSVSKRSLSK